MVALLIGGDDGPGDGLPPWPDDDLAGWLVEQRRCLDRTEARWLQVLAAFDRATEWALDGFFSCAHWLAYRTGLARSTAHEKVRVAAELYRRPWLAHALEGGLVSYSAIRAIARIDVVDEALDRSLLELARASTAETVERAVRHWQAIHDQDTPPAPDRSGVRIQSGYGDGLGRLVVDAPNDAIEELMAAIRAFVHDEEPADGVPVPSWAQRRLDALMDLSRTALANADQGDAAGADRYLVHVVADVERLVGGAGRAEHLGGATLDNATLTRVLCDCSYVQHLTAGGTEPLMLGRKTREWSTAQRRAITVRDGGRCRIPGCTNRRVDIHHLHDWSLGGPTDIGNGACMCRAHHTMIHRGELRVAGNSNHDLVVRRGDGTPIAVSKPPGNLARLF